ncbi:MAG: glycosyltransferase [Thermodesulfovibrionales bacterium]|jgi:glycosyltransferase involved in cell wall biosynthesis
MPSVSIIITSYNYGRFLFEAIDSALHQTYKETEVIVVDDGSTDNSRERIASYGKRITAVLKENGGQASAFNAGFSVSNGDIIIFLDSDDSLCLNAVEEVVKVWYPEISKVHYRLQWIDAEGNLLNSYCPPAGTHLPFGDLKTKFMQEGVYNTPPTSGNAFGRWFLQLIMPIPEDEWHLYTDAYLHLHAPIYGEIAAVQETLGYYRVHGSNASSLVKYKSYKDRLVREIAMRNRREALILKAANKMNLQPCFDPTVIIAKKLALLLICPEHSLIKNESLIRLVLRGFRAIWNETDIPVWKQIAVSAYFILVPFIPRGVAKNLSYWYVFPESRPSFMKHLI